MLVLSIFFAYLIAPLVELIYRPITLRVERNPGQPLAALELMNASDEWRGLVWEHAAYLHSLPDNSYEED